MIRGTLVVPHAVVERFEKVERFLAQRLLAVGLASDPGPAGHAYLAFDPALPDRRSNAATTVVAAGNNATIPMAIATR
jgi:hypothetical protein